MESTARQQRRLTARPRSASSRRLAGEQRLGLDRSPRRRAIRASQRQTPSDRAQGRPSAMPLLVLLHGAGGTGEGVLRRIRDAAEEAGVAVLAPDSRESTWDAIRVGFGADVAFIDRALARAFETLPVDPARVAIGGVLRRRDLRAVAQAGQRRSVSARRGVFCPGFWSAACAWASRWCSSRTARPIRFCRSIEPAGPIVPRAAGARLRCHVPRDSRAGHEVPPAIAREGLHGSKTLRRCRVDRRVRSPKRGQTPFVMVDPQRV